MIQLRTDYILLNFANHKSFFFSMARRIAELIVKKEGRHQKFRPERPRRTIQNDGLHDVQCRPIALVPLLHDPGVPNQGKYEEEKEKRRKSWELKGK
jgi:hypothetical protein